MSDDPRPEGDKKTPAPSPRETRTHVLERIDGWWTRLETRLCLAVLLLEILALCFWVSLRGLASDYAPGSPPAGLIYRAFLGATLFGTIAHFVTRPKKSEAARTAADSKAAAKRHDVAVAVAVLVGMLVARFWVHVGVHYASNMLNWLQNASVITFFGGLRGLATRLTLWLALLGASLATSKGKHINVDVLARFVPIKLRVPIAALGTLVASAVCITGAFAFLDYIAIAEFRNLAEKPCVDDPNKFCEVTAGEKASNVKLRMSRDLFLLGRQTSLDFKTLPHVLSGEPYERYLGAKEWNEWMRGADWTAHFPKEAVDGQILSEEDAAFRRMPMVNVPGVGEQTRGLLIREATFILPFGLFMIGLRFVLRALQILGGRVRIDPDAVHGDDDLVHAGHDESMEPMAKPPRAEEEQEEGVA